MALRIDWQGENPPRSAFFKEGRICNRIPLFGKAGLGEIGSEKAKD